ncbi:MAG TPA: hypothetical protein VF384_15515 [Planctomycetota bacterium]
MRWHEIGLFSMAVALLPAQETKPRLQIDDAGLRAMVARAVPAVERACGRKFAKPPVVALADVGDVMRSLREDLLPGTKAFFAGQPAQRIEKALQLRADMFAASVLAKYGVNSREVYVMPHAVGTQLGAVECGDADHEKVLTLVVVHELVHALQDQEIGLAERVARCTGQDSGEAFAMLIEGHAVFCSERAAAELDLVEVIPALRAVFAGHRDSTAFPPCDLTMRRVRHQNGMLYLSGASFFAAQHSNGGDERCWQVLRTELPTTRLVLEGGDRPPRRSLAEAFAGVDEVLAGRNWTVGRGELSGLMIRGENARMLTELETLLAKWQAGGEWFAVAPTPLSWRAFYALTFDDEASAAAFALLVENGARSDLEKLGKGRLGEVGDGPQVAGASSRRIVQELPKGVPVGNRATLVLVRKGRHVLQLLCNNAPVEDAAFAAVAAGVLARLEQ